MQTISYTDIDFNNLERLDVNSSESDIFLQRESNKSYIYKIFKDCLDAYSLTLKSEKLRQLMKRKEILGILVPDAKIVDDSLVGVREEYIEGVDLCDVLQVYDKDESMNILLDVSSILKDIHKDGIIVSDFNFGNIRIDKERRPHFIDSLSYNIDGIPENTSSYIINEYLKRNKKKYKASKNNDKIAFLMLTIQMYLNKYFYDITNEDFESAKDKIQYLRQLEDIFYDLKTSYVKDAPYLHELIK